MRGVWIVVFVMPTIAAAQEQTCAPVSGPSVAASGTVNLRVRPDRVAFSVGVETTRPSVTEALAANNAKVAAVVSMLKTKGVSSAEIQTADFAIDSKDDEGRRLPGFRVSNQVGITLSDTSSVGSLLQAAVNAGANQAGGIRFFVGEPGQHRDRGLELAFQAATAKAAKLAGLAGRALGEVICVAEGGFPTSRNLTVTENVVVAGAAGIEEGMEELPFTVNVVYALK